MILIGRGLDLKDSSESLLEVSWSTSCAVFKVRKPERVSEKKRTKESGKEETESAEKNFSRKAKGREAKEKRGK